MIDREARALGFRSHIKTLNGLAFHIVEAGSGPALIFLHGFPEYWGSWQTLMSSLQSQYRCIAPDLRGYGHTAKPLSEEGYRKQHLVADGLALLDYAGQGPHVVIGHDWGATLAFYLALEAPDRIRQLIILNGAHPYVLQNHIWDNPEQRQASQYMASLMSKGGEHDLRAENAREIANRWLSEALDEGRITQAHYDRFVELWSEPGNWTAMINWYRAAGFQVPGPTAPAPVQRWTDGLNDEIACPLTMIWGHQDPVFSKQMLTDVAKLTPRFELFELQEAGHVPHRDAPEKCIEIIRKCTAE